MSAKGRPILLLACAVGVSAVYAFGCLMVFQGEGDYEKIKRPPLNLSLIPQASRAMPLHRPEYFRVLADRYQYYPHDPKDIPPLYLKAILRGPADYHNFFSYAQYLSSRNCCKETIRNALLETMRRCPTNPDMHRVAAAYFLVTQQKEAALPIFRRAIELEPSAAQRLYSLLEQNGAGVDTIIRVTPVQPDSLIQLCRYLGAKGESAQAELKQCVIQLSQFKLDSQQQLDTAALAAQAGLEEITLRYGQAATGSLEMKAHAYELLAEQAWKNRKWADYLRYSAQVEEAYRERGMMDQAAESALRAALRFTSTSKAEATERVLDVINRYPRYAPAYAQMAMLSRDQSEELELVYLKKAAELAPGKPDYQDPLADFYLKKSRYQEAEGVYQALIVNPDTLEAGYLGLSRCKLKQGERFQAITILEEAMVKGIRTERIMAELAGLFNSVGYDQKALSLAMELIERYPEDAAPRNIAGDAYVNLARYEDARRQYEEALTLDPNNSTAQQALTRLQSLGY